MDKVFVYGIPQSELPKYQVKPAVGNVPVPERDSINYEVLDEIMAFIKAHPTTWVQDSWYKIVDRETGDIKFEIKTEEVEEVNSCGTSFCFAGHTALREGFPAPPLNQDELWERTVIRKDEAGEWEDLEDANDFARQVLGLTYEQADALFDAGNSMDDLQTMVDVLHLFPSINGYKLDSIRFNELSLAQVIEMVAENPDKWLDEEKPAKTVDLADDF